MLIVHGYQSNNTAKKKHIQLEPDEDIYFDHYGPKALHDILYTQHKNILYGKEEI